MPEMDDLTDLDWIAGRMWHPVPCPPQVGEETEESESKGKGKGKAASSTSDERSVPRPSGDSPTPSPSSAGWGGDSEDEDAAPGSTSAASGMRTGDTVPCPHNGDAAGGPAGGKGGIHPVPCPHSGEGGKRGKGGKGAGRTGGKDGGEDPYTAELREWYAGFLKRKAERLKCGILDRRWTNTKRKRKARPHRRSD